MPFGEKVLARPTVEQNESQIRIVETAECVFRAREVRRMEHQDRWDKEATNNVIGVPWRIADGHCIVDRPATQIDPCRLRELECRGRESTGLTAKPSEPLQDAWVAVRSDLESEPKLTQTWAASESRNVSKHLQKDLSAWIEEERF